MYAEWERRLEETVTRLNEAEKHGIFIGAETASAIEAAIRVLEYLTEEIGD